MAAVSETEMATGAAVSTSYEAELRELVRDAHANGLRCAMILALEIGLAEPNPERRRSAAVIAAAIEAAIRRGETGSGADG
jgi:hypothetical protein